MFKIYASNEKCLPQRAHKGDAGLDLVAAESVTLKHGTPTLVSCGIHIEMPDGCAGFIFARSGLAIKHGVTLVNGVGVIDSTYRGEIKCALMLSAVGCKPTYRINKYDRIAQLITMPYLSRTDGSSLYLTADSLEELSDTDRGDKGFGSTG